MVCHPLCVCVPVQEWISEANVTGRTEATGGNGTAKRAGSGSGASGAVSSNLVKASTTTSLLFLCQMTVCFVVFRLSFMKEFRSYTNITIVI